MTILILGAAGNLGTAYSRLLADQEDIKLVAWDKTDLDVTDQGILSKKIFDIKPDVIINLVAYNQVDACEKNKKNQTIARRLNVEFVKILAEIALAVNAILVHYSSDYVFKGDKVEGYDETDTPEPQNFYGQTKFDGEKELLKLTGKGLKWYLIRTARLFGPKGSSSLAKRNFFDLMLSLAAKNQELKAVNNEVGSFTYTVDLVKASWDLILEACPYGVYHLVNSGSASWYEGAKYFLRAKLDSRIDLAKIKSITSQDLTQPAKRPEYSVLINTKRPVLRSWQEAVDDYIRN